MSASLLCPFFTASIPRQQLAQDQLGISQILRWYALGRGIVYCTCTAAVMYHALSGKLSSNAMELCAVTFADFQSTFDWVHCWHQEPAVVDHHWRERNFYMVEPSPIPDSNTAHWEQLIQEPPRNVRLTWIIYCNSSITHILKKWSAEWDKCLDQVRPTSASLHIRSLMDETQQHATVIDEKKFFFISSY